MFTIEWIPETVRQTSIEPPFLRSLGLQHHPFPVAPDDKHFYVSEHIEQMVAEIVHGIEMRKGFMVISGDVGLGKTTITRRILHILNAKEINTSFVFHTSLKNVDLLREINRDFGIKSNGQCGLGEELQLLNAFLLSQYQKGRNSAVIIDDAQNLDRASLELVRMISNLEADRRKLVQILLVGQPELSDTLDLPELRQLKSRIFIEKSARPLTREQLRTYLMFKLSLAGNRGRITVTESALGKLHRYARGNFRQISMLMDRCLYALCRDDASLIDGKIVKMAYADLHRKDRSAQWRQSRWRKFWRWPALAASVCLPAAVIVAAFWLHLEISRGATAAAGLSSPSIPSFIDAPMENVNDRGSSEKNRAIVETVKSDINPEIQAFLKNSRLDAYAADFQRSYSSGNLTTWAQQIYRQSGLQLVQLPRVSDTLGRQYGALALPSIYDNDSGWLLFWKPELVIDQFYYGLKSPAIAALQRMLAKFRFYDGKIDSVVGPHLMKALVSFQQSKGLPVTGLPDVATLFVLHHLPEEHL